MFLLISGILGGLVIFLLGVNRITDSLKGFLGYRIKPLLAMVVRSKFISFVVGVGISVATQSSSVATALLVSMVNSKMMMFEDSISLMIGASVGTIVAVQIIAFDIKAYFPVMLAAGFFLRLAGKTEKIKVIGNVFLGFGMIFLGMQLIGNYIGPIKDSIEVMGYLSSLSSHPFVVFLIATAFTMIMQSNMPVLAIGISMASKGMIGLDVALPLIIGSHVGSASVVLFSAVGASTAAKKLAWATFLYKSIGGVVAMTIIPFIVAVVSHTSSYLPREFANAQMFVVGLNALLVIFWSKRFARVVERVLPVKEGVFEGLSKPEFIDEKVTSVPLVSVYLTTQELVRVANIVEELILKVKKMFERGEILWSEMKKYDEIVDELTRRIVEFASSVEATSKEERREIMKLVFVANEIEYIEDLVERGIITPLKKKEEQGLVFPSAVSSSLLEGFSLVKLCFRNAVGVLALEDINIARRSVETYRKVKEWDKRFRVRCTSVVARNGSDVRISPLLIDISNTLKTIADHSMLIIETVVGQEISEAA